MLVKKYYLTNFNLILPVTLKKLYYNKFMFKLDEFMGRRVLKSSLLNNEEVSAFFTTRDLPLKAGEREDLAEEIENNKKLVCKGLDIPFKNLIIPVQTHSSNIKIVNLKKLNCRKVDESNISSRFTLHSSLYEDTDALITNEPQIALALNFADCVPIILYDPVKKVIAAAHAGWRGTAAKIGPKTVNKMIENFECDAKDIIALIGPSIGKCCFEVKEDVLKDLMESVDNQCFNAFSKNNADLKLINEFQLLACGVKKIDVCEYCTSCQNELFFSYRKENGKTARHSAVIIVKREA